MEEFLIYFPYRKKKNIYSLLDDEFEKKNLFYLACICFGSTTVAKCPK